MNKRQIQILALAVVAVVFIVFINMRPLLSAFSSNAATVTVMIDNRPIYVELAIAVIVFAALFVLFTTPKKRG